MHSIWNILSSISIETLFTRGAFFGLLLLLMLALMPARIRLGLSGSLSYRSDNMAFYLIALLLISSLLYLAFPNFIDHGESTIAALGTIMQDSDALYPAPDAYPYHGILYGPGLAEIQLLFRHIGLPLLIESKLPGIVAFFCTVQILLHLNKRGLSRGYLIYLLPFGVMLFWNRAEPFFLLMVSLVLLLGRYYSGRLLLPLVSGCLAGLASALKLHGALYVLAAYLAVSVATGLSGLSVVLFLAGATAAFTLPFVPQSVSVWSFFHYLRLAGNQGWSFWVWLDNAMYLAFLSIPVFTVWRQSKPSRCTNISLLMIFGIEFLVTLIGAKPGAGVHHLLPFIPVNAYFIHMMCKDAGDESNITIKVLYASLLATTLVVFLITAGPAAESWRHYAAAEQELSRYDRQYSGVIMGLTGDSTYKYTFLRVQLSHAQIDYPGYMDLQYAGIKDSTLVSQLQTCAIAHMLLPTYGTPFSMPSYYTGLPIFSDAVRQAFAAHYRLTETATYYALYTCQPSTSTTPH